jgi:two-component system, cell cycle sensor histidine kinase and response regulator CckA
MTALSPSPLSDILPKKTAGQSLPSIRCLWIAEIGALVLLVVAVFAFLDAAFLEKGRVPSHLIGVTATFLVVAFVIAVLLHLVRRRISDNHKLLLGALDAGPTPQALVGPTGDILLTNAVFRGWIGLSDTMTEADILTRLQSAPDSVAVFERLKDSARLGRIDAVELPLIREPLGTEWVRVTTRPMPNLKDHTIWRFENITDRRRIERAIREESERIVDFMAHAPVGIYSVDEEGRFNFVNRTLADWLGYDSSEMIRDGIRLHEVFLDPPTGTPPYALTVGPEGTRRADVTLKGRQGRVFPAAITQTLVIGERGEVLRTRSVVRDLTPEQAWRELHELSQQRFKRLFAEAPIGTAHVDDQTRIVECNQALLTLLGVQRGDMVEHPLTEFLPQDLRAGFVKALADVGRGTDLRKPIEMTLTGKREAIVQIYARRFTAERSLDGKETSGLLLHFIDATEQKHLERQFAQSQKMQAIGQLAGGVAHDFNNLLTAMIGFCDLLLLRHKPGDQSFNDIMQIKQNANRAANLVRQLLAFSRQQTLQPKVLVLTDVLTELTNLMRRLIGASIELKLTHGRDLWLVKVDQGQFEQVVINLVVNARDAMSGGGKLSITTTNHHQNVLISRGQDEMPPGDYVLIEVQDTGVGIPKENMQRIFDPFFSTKEIGSGTGLGLSTVYGIVRQTGGFVVVDSAPGKGAKFSVFLPRHIETPEAAAAAAKAEEIKEAAAGDLTGAGTVLFVEDEDGVRMSSVRYLTNRGYTVMEAGSGSEALVVLEQHADKIDLLVTDVVMPQMDGPTLVREVRQKWPNMKVIFISGYTEDRLRDQFNEGGEAVHFLGKPFTLKQLAGKVKEVMSGGTGA